MSKPKIKDACSLLLVLLACSNALGEEPCIMQKCASETEQKQPHDLSLETTALSSLSLEQAVFMAFANNRALALERMTPEISRTFEEEERAAFDPAFDGELTMTRASNITTNALEKSESDRLSAGLGLSETLPTGTKINLRASGATLESEGEKKHSTHAEAVLTQPLLRGRAVRANLARLRQTQMDTELSVWELIAVAQNLVAGVEAAYWECALAKRRVEILETSLALAEQQASEIAQRIKVGTLPETEHAAARAESALRREDLINAASALTASELRLLRLVAPALLATGARQPLVLHTAPVAPALILESVSEYVATAMKMRPDLNEARLRLERQDLEVVRTRNGLLPKLDLFMRLGGSGYATSFSDAVNNFAQDEWEGVVGLAFEFPIINRAERARSRRARISQEQKAESLLNLTDLARLDVEIAHLEVVRTRAQITATAETRRLQEEKVRAENAKFVVGRSTALSAALAQRDFVDSQISEAAALVRHLEAWLALFRADGSLLERRGLSVEP